MTSYDLKKIKFTYGQNEHLFKIPEALPLEKFLNQVKVFFKIPTDTHLDIIDMQDNMSITPLSTAHLWSYSAAKIPRYRIITTSSFDKEINVKKKLWKLLLFHG
jgi:hypothetical protein